MSMPSIENLTPFTVEHLCLADEQARPLLVVVVKATYRIIQNRGVLELAEEQAPINLSGEYWGDPTSSSYKYEPEIAFFKPATDVVLIGTAYAQRHGETKIDVAFSVGPVKKLIRVVGDRYWYKSLGICSMTKPKPIDRVPLIYERAFGGWDRSNPDPEQHTFEARNPVGTGFRKKRGKFEEGIQLPNLENPRHPLRSYTGRPPPIGFGFVSPNWEPRVSLGGTYGQDWMQTQMPRFPKDFSRRYFNAAPLDQTVPGFLKGDERVLIKRVSKRGSLSFQLPGVSPPQCLAVVKHLGDKTLETRLDTVIINSDENLVFLIWRANLVLRDGLQDVVSLEIRGNGSSPNR